VTEFKDNTKTGCNGLTKLCDETEWTEGLWLHCHSRCGVNHTSICGGLNNVRNRVQTCLRLAIDAGMGLIMPSAFAPSSSTSPRKAASGIGSSAMAVFDEAEASAGAFEGYGSLYVDLGVERGLFYDFFARYHVIAFTRP
jgi:hypothetical protein